VAEPVGADELNVIKLVRMQALVARVLVESRSGDLDAGALDRLQGLTQQTLVEIGSAVPAELLRELAAVVGGPSTTPPTADELRIVEAQLLGWLHGIAASESYEDALAAVAAVTALAAVAPVAPVVPTARPLGSPGYL
jgi:hypothetical protein